MSTTCYAVIRGSTLRVTALSPKGAVTDPSIAYAVSRSVTKVTINETTDAATGGVERDEYDRPRIALPDITDLIGYQVDVSFIRVDPGFLSLLTGLPLVLNAAGDVAGFDMQTRLPVVAFALEVWSKLANSQQWGYTLFPNLRGGYMQGYTIEDDLVSFTVTNANSRNGALWSSGPYDVYGPFERLDKPVSGNDAWRQMVVDQAPPAQTDGIKTFIDSIDNGTAADPQPDPTTPAILDAGDIDTSAWIISGGAA